MLRVMSLSSIRRGNFLLLLEWRKTYRMRVIERIFCLCILSDLPRVPLISLFMESHRVGKRKEPENCSLFSYGVSRWVYLLASFSTLSDGRAMYSWQILRYFTRLLWMCALVEIHFDRR